MLIDLLDLFTSGRLPTYFESSIIIIINIINPLTRRVVGAPQMILKPVFSIFPCSPLPSGTCRTPVLSIPWSCLPTSSSVLPCLLPPFTVPCKMVLSHPRALNVQGQSPSILRAPQLALARCALSLIGVADLLSELLTSYRSRWPPPCMLMLETDFPPGTDLTCSHALTVCLNIINTGL